MIILGSLVAIQYANGGFRSTSQGVNSRSGLLAANSVPTGAEVKINGNLITATDDTVYLDPAEYQVEIKKDGYNSWSKSLKIEPELVTQTNARLFPKAPSLTALSFSGAKNIHPSPNGEKIVYYVASASASEKNGLYILDLNTSTLSLQKESRQITDDPTQVDLDKAHYIWSPDSSQLLLFSGNTQVKLNTESFSKLLNLPSIVFEKASILSDWEEEMILREQEFLAQFPDEIVTIATQSAVNIYVSPDKKRLLYTATDAATLKDNILPALPASNNQPEERKLEVAGIYVYDREEDKNFRVGSDTTYQNSPKKVLLSAHNTQTISQLLDATPDETPANSLQADNDNTTSMNFNAYHSALYSSKYQWFPDSKHLIFIEDNSIKVKEYDGTNVTTIYSGLFNQNFVYPWPNGDRLLITTSFNPNTPENLYAIELR